MLINSNLVMEKSSLDETVEIYKAQIAATDVSSKYFKPKRVAAYCRVSKNIEMQQSSLETQIEAYERIISERLDWQLVEIYYDKGITGTCAAKRPGFMRMIEDCKAGKIDMILAKSISRFARNTVDTLEYTRMLRNLGIGVYFEKEKVDTSDLASEMLLTVYAAFAQEESHSISENVRRGYKQRFQMGIAKYGKTFGYTSDKEDKNIWHIVESEAEIIRELFDRYLKGEKLHEICADFNKRGLPSPNGNFWYQSSASKILKNEKYVGDVTMQKTVVVDLLNHVSKKNNGIAPIYVKKNHHPAIVDRETFETIQRMLELKSSAHGSQQYPYYDFIRCPKCGKPMVQYMAPLMNNPRALICSDHKHCQSHFVLAKYIDKSIKEAILDLPDCLTGYEEAICSAKERYLKGEDVELYHLKSLVDKIEFNDELTSVTIKFKFGKEVTSDINFIHPSDRPNPVVEYKGNNILVDGLFYDQLIAKRICDSISKIQKFNKEVEVIVPTEPNGVYRIKNSGNNSKSNWGRKKREDNSN